jgi:hypothetical protein
MEPRSIAALKEHLLREGHGQRAVVSDHEMTRAQELLDSQPGIVDTPAEELRYIEGLLGLPYGHLPRFRVLPAEGYGRCACGRTLTALDLVHTALRKRIHDRELMRDTLIGFSNLIELAEDGRAAECFNCGRATLSSSYWTHAYMYA